MFVGGFVEGDLRRSCRGGLMMGIRRAVRGEKLFGERSLLGEGGDQSQRDVKG